MSNITNIAKLGSEFTVSDNDGNFIKKIQVIPHTEILQAALGPFTGEFTNIKNYLEKSIAVLEGFEDLDTNAILWYSTTEEEIILADLIEYAVNNGYDKIILEHLEAEE